LTYLGLHSQNLAEEELDGDRVLAEGVATADETELGGGGVLVAEGRSADEVMGLLVISMLEVVAVDIEVSGVSVAVIVVD
jgi:hypothetical protein